VFGPYERPVQYYETDRMKIVHHSNYVRWFEEARLYFLESIGLPYDRLEETGILIPVLSVDVQYKKAFTFGDTFQIFLKCVRFNGVKCEFKYEVRDKETGEVRTTGGSSHCFVTEDMKPFHMKMLYPDIFDTLKACVKE